MFLIIFACQLLRAQILLDPAASLVNFARLPGVVGPDDVLHEAALGRAADGPFKAEKVAGGGEEAGGAVGVRGRVETDSLALVVGIPKETASVIWSIDTRYC